MLRYQLKSTNFNNQDNMHPPKPSNLTIVGPEKCNIAEEQDKDFKITIRKIFNILKENMNKSPNETYENTDE